LDRNVLLNASEKFQRFNDAFQLYPPIVYTDIYLHNKTVLENDQIIVEKVHSNSTVYIITKSMIKEDSNTSANSNSRPMQGSAGVFFSYKTHLVCLGFVWQKLECLLNFALVIILHLFIYFDRIN